MKAEFSVRTELADVRCALRRVERHRRLRRYWRPVLLSGVLCLLLFQAVLGIEVVSGASMAPTLRTGDVILFQRLGVQIQLGDMVVIQADTTIDVIKRVVAAGGDTLSVSPDGRMKRNGLAELEPFAWYGGQDSSGWCDFPLTVPEGEIFYMGDNRALSLDSRTAEIGPVPMEQVAGKVLFVFSW